MYTKMILVMYPCEGVLLILTVVLTTSFSLERELGCFLGVNPSLSSVHFREGFSSGVECSIERSLSIVVGGSKLSSAMQAGDSDYKKKNKHNILIGRRLTLRGWVKEE